MVLCVHLFQDVVFYPIIVRLETQTEEGVLVYEIFAVSHIKNDDVWYSYQVESEEADFDYLVGHLLENADYSTKNLPVFGDRLITLSTCHGKEDDDRLVVVGRLVEAKE